MESVKAISDERLSGELKEILKRKRISCIAFDLDRTLLNAEGRLSDRTRRALDAAAVRGIELAAASGRPFCALPQEVLGEESIHYAIVSNGAAIYQIFHKADRENFGVRMKTWTIAPSDVEKILEMTGPSYAADEISYEVSADGIAYAQESYLSRLPEFGFAPKGVLYTRSTRQAVPDIFALIQENHFQIESLNIVMKDSRRRAGLSKQLDDSLPGIYVTSSSSNRIEISNCSASKDGALAFLLEKLRLDPQELLAFGDGENDADMLEFAGIGAAVSNAVPECREAADFICPSHDADGPAQVIELCCGVQM